jgi:hypothetical protein
MSFWNVCPKMAYNGKRLCAGGALKHESFNSAQKPNRITAVEFSNSAPLAQNVLLCVRAGIN